ncbi:Mfs transporter [Aspergillus sclerotialis]|uniref:Mfs transporter n=1 Tax=Aspergillus sclerotialis TaxID=2070753 RepID=A0A3A2ZUY5_9EURO|nr:Mfs transporter [Aspergillus sclerotialis]
MELSMSALENAEHDEGLAIDVISSTAIIATKDPLDPLNWSFVKKWACILIACLSYFTQLYFTTVIIPCFGLLQAQLHATYNQVNWIFGVSALGMAAGPLLTASIADTYGRRIVLIFSTMIALVSCGCTSLHNISFSGYMAARFFLGLGAGPSANISLSIINDVSFEHERGFRVGLWAVSANVGSFAGAVVGGFIALVSQYWATYHLTIFFAFTLTCQCLFLPETNYPRAAVLEHEYRARERKDNSRDMEEISLKRTRQLGYLVFSI